MENPIWMRVIHFCKSLVDGMGFKTNASQQKSFWKIAAWKNQLKQNIGKIQIFREFSR